MALPGFVSAALERHVAAHGFHAVRRDTYERQTEDGVSVLAFVTDKWGGPPTSAHFTAHLGFYSFRLADVFGALSRRPEAESLHWYRWIGYLDERDDDHDLYWEVNVDDVESLRSVLDELTSRAFPTLSSHSSDAGLRDDWMARKDPFLHPAIQTSYLAVLVSAIGPLERKESLLMDVKRLAEAGASDAALALSAIS
jgi:hypothetical protein